MATTPESPSVEDYVAEAEVARERMASTIDELQDKLNPKRIVEDTVARVQDRSNAIATRAGDVVRSHPLAIGAAVVAVGLALAARARVGGATLDLGDDMDGYTDYDDGYGAAPQRLYDDEYDDGGNGGGYTGGYDGSDNGPSLSDRASALADRAGALTTRATHTMGDNPLLSVLAGLAAGAALGALFPVTQTERRALGDTSGRIGAAARAALRQAKTELDAAGLRPETIKSTVAQVRDRAAAAAASVKQAAQSELKS